MSSSHPGGRTASEENLKVLLDGSLEFHAVNTFEKPSAKDHAGGRIHFEKSGID